MVLDEILLFQQDDFNKNYQFDIRSGKKKINPIQLLVEPFILVPRVIFTFMMAGGGFIAIV